MTSRYIQAAHAEGVMESGRNARGGRRLAHAASIKRQIAEGRVSPAFRVGGARRTGEVRPQWVLACALWSRSRPEVGADRPAQRAVRIRRELEEDTGIVWPPLAGQ